MVKKLKGRSLVSPEALLATTGETIYNEILITGTHPDNSSQRVTIQGVFLKTLPSGEYVADPETVYTFKRLAAQNSLPVLEIPEPFVEYRSSGKAEAFIGDTLDLATMKNDGKSYAIALNLGSERYLVEREIGEFGERAHKTVFSNGGVSSRPMSVEEYQNFLSQVKEQLPSNSKLQEVYAKVTGVEFSPALGEETTAKPAAETRETDRRQETSDQSQEASATTPPADKRSDIRAELRVMTYLKMALLATGLLGMPMVAGAASGAVIGRAAEQKFQRFSYAKTVEIQTLINEVGKDYGIRVKVDGDMAPETVRGITAI